MNYLANWGIIGVWNESHQSRHWHGMSRRTIVQDSSRRAALRVPCLCCPKRGRHRNLYNIRHPFVYDTASFCGLSQLVLDVISRTRTALGWYCTATPHLFLLLLLLLHLLPLKRAFLPRNGTALQQHTAQGVGGHAHAKRRRIGQSTPREH